MTRQRFRYASFAVLAAVVILSGIAMGQAAVPHVDLVLSGYGARAADTPVSTSTCSTATANRVRTLTVQTVDSGGANTLGLGLAVSGYSGPGTYSHDVETYRLYFTDSASEASIQVAVAQVERLPGVTNVRFQDKDQARAEAKASGMTDIDATIATLGANPLPASVELTIPIQNADQLSAAMNRFSILDQPRLGTAGSGTAGSGLVEVMLRGQPPASSPFAGGSAAHADLVYDGGTVTVNQGERSGKVDVDLAAPGSSAVVAHLSGDWSC